MSQKTKNFQKEITTEFSNLFTTLTSRVQVFQSTQKKFLENLNPTIAKILPNILSDDIEIAAAIYGICLTDNALENYEIEQFSEDIGYLKSLLENDLQEVKDVKKEIFEPIADKYTKDLVAMTSPTSSAKRTTWSERAKQAIETETVFMKLLTAYYQANSYVKKEITFLANDLILHLTNERTDQIIISLLIREYLIPLYNNIVKIYESVPINVDLRYISGQIIVALERLLYSSKNSTSQANHFLRIKETYPLGYGDDLYWDLSKEVLMKIYYPLLKNKFQSQVNEAKKYRVPMKKIPDSDRLKLQQGTTESIRSKIKSFISEIFQFNRTFDHNRRMMMQRTMETVLKQMALQKYNAQDIPSLEKFTNYFNEEFLRPLFDEYPQLYMPFIDIRYYKDFVNDPLDHINNHHDYVLSQFWFAIRRHTKTANPNSSQLAHAFSMVMFDVLHDDRVRNSDI
ncbi:MAG: hypothetical protein ACXAD7_00495 [Candidatus Kariarchaeaceae archaeon]|jgi:hypothetical protein